MVFIAVVRPFQQGERGGMDPTNELTYRSFVRSGVANRQQTCRAPIRFRSVSYDFGQLRKWKRTASTLLEDPDVVLVEYKGRT